MNDRDDDTQPLRPNTTGEQMTKKTVETALKDGILVGGMVTNYRIDWMNRLQVETSDISDRLIHKWETTDAISRMIESLLTWVFLYYESVRYIGYSSRRQTVETMLIGDLLREYVIYWIDWCKLFVMVMK